MANERYLVFHRRDWIKVAGAAIAARSADAELQCGPYMPPGIQQCIAGIPQERLNGVFAYQQASEWCWAACIQMVFAYWGHVVSQQEIVQRTWGTIANMPAQPTTIIGDLNRRWTLSSGDSFDVSGDVFSANGATAAQDLAGDMPLIIGSMGHAMVLTAISYNRAANSQGQVTGAIVRDPWPGNGGRRPLSPQEAAATMLLARIRVS